MTSNKKTNRLIAEKSPYLLQHAYNPVDWYAWGDEALEKAKRENKPIFLSIGYSTCHWCHVMEKESFEDEEVAALLNEHFVSIKVDREERPDLDSIYMSVCQLMTGQGGWPLNVFLTPEQVPFYTGVYFPKTSRFGRPGMIEVVSQLADIFKNDKEKIASVGEQIKQALVSKKDSKKVSSTSEQMIEEAYHRLNVSFDPQYGGFGEAPKFPLPHQLMFLLRYYRLHKDTRALHMVEKTLNGLARGGIYDHIGFGFSRYSTDGQYLVPHFEKMLYDNALLAICYTEAYQITNHSMYQKIVEEINTYVLRDMTSDEGAFFSAEDADSEGVEGKFYVWTKNEIINILGEKLGRLFCEVYDITSHGNFEGKNIPNLIQKSIEEYVKENNLPLDETAALLQHAREQLFRYRENRIHPHKDDKVLTAWNALMIAALAKAGKVFEKDTYIQAAKKAEVFIEKNLVVNGRVMVRFRDGDVKQKGFIDEYAYLLWAYIELYEATLDLTYLKKAQKLSQKMLDLFWDHNNGGFYFYGEDNEKLLIRPKEAYDGALPSGNSVAALQLLRLARLTSNQQLEEKVSQILEAFSEELSRYPYGHTYLLQVYILMQLELKEIIFLTKDDSLKSITLLQKEFYPEINYLVAKNSDQLQEIAPFLADYKKRAKNVTIYLCENFVCHEPYDNEEKLIQFLQNR